MIHYIHKIFSDDLDFNQLKERILWIQIDGKKLLMTCLVEERLFKAFCNLYLVSATPLLV